MKFDREELSRLMDRKFYNGAELAQAVGTTRQTVYRWLRGEAKPSTKHFKAICETLGVEPDRLLLED